MKSTSILSVGLIGLGGTILLMSQIMVYALPEPGTGAAANGVGGLWNLLLDGVTWVLNKGGLALGGIPLVAGICGLLASGLPSVSLPIAGEGPSNFQLEEEWEYLPQEGRVPKQPSSGA